MIPKRLPKKFHKFFWDTPKAQLNLDTHRRYIAERILENGTIEAVVWLKKTFGKKFIIGVVKTSRSLSRKTANFFQKIYQIPREEILCFQEDFRQKHKRIWTF